LEIASMTTARPKRLTALFIRSNKLAAGMYCDGGGLYLHVRDSGSRSWIFRYRQRGSGKLRDIGLGSAGRDGVSLEDARERVAELRAGVRRGLDPLKAKQTPETKALFGEFADALLETIKSGFKNPSSERDWKRDLEVRCGALRPKILQDITTDDVRGVLAPIWTTIPRTARETRGGIERVFDAARARGLYSGENSARWKGHLKELLPRLKRVKRHHPAAPYADIPSIVQKLRERHAGAHTNVNLAAEFVMLTAVRTSEARVMRVREIDYKARLWTIPHERMKTPRDHEVPLCDRAFAILGAVIPKDAEAGDFVFKGIGSNPGRTFPSEQRRLLWGIQPITGSIPRPFSPR
jgi:integrase